MSVVEAVRPTVNLDDVLAAAERIRDLAKKTPVLTSQLFNDKAGAPTFFKCENLQRGGSFKIRGALNFIAQLTPEERRRGVVTFSSGNHAQAVAIAAAHLGVKATIVMPTDAPKAKLASTQAYGPEIVFYNRHTDDREALSARISEQTGAVVLPSYDHPWIVAGQGTAALELLQEHPDLGTLAVPLGGGGLLSGTLTVARALRPSLCVYGVEPEQANDWHQSLAKGERTRIAAPDTIADGLRTPMPGVLPFEIVRKLNGCVVTVSEAEIRSTMRFLLTRLKLLVEPSGAVAAAAVLTHKINADGGGIGVILSGGNVDFDVIAQICSEAA